MCQRVLLCVQNMPAVIAVEPMFLEVVLVLGMDNLTVSPECPGPRCPGWYTCKVLADMQSKGQVQCQILCYLCLIWVSSSFWLQTAYSRYVVKCRYRQLVDRSNSSSCTMLVHMSSCHPSALQQCNVWMGAVQVVFVLYNVWCMWKAVCKGKILSNLLEGKLAFPRLFQNCAYWFLITFHRLCLVCL
jgi:hypothetical protein